MRLKKRTLVLLGVMVVAIAAAFGAYAYFTTTGSGTGSATVGTSSNLVLAGTTVDTLYPGTSTEVDFTAKNNSPGHQQLGTIYLASVVACDSAFVAGVCSGSEIPTCESVDPGNVGDAGTSQFYMADVVSNQDFPAGGSPQTVTATGTLTLHNLGVSQDQCKSAKLLLNLATR